MTYRHAFGPAGRTRGIDHIGLAFPVDARLRYRPGRGHRRLQAQRRRIAQYAIRLVDQGQHDRAVLGGETQALRGVVRVHRHIGRPGLEYAQHCRDYGRRARSAQADAIAGADTLRCQCGRDTIRGLRQARIVPVAAGMGDGDARRRGRGCPAQRRDQIRVRIERQRRRVEACAGVVALCRRHGQRIE